MYIEFEPDGLHGAAVGILSTLTTSNGGKTWHEGLAYHRYPAPWYWLSVLLLAGLVTAFTRRRQSEPATEESIRDVVVSDRPLRPGDPDPLGFEPVALGLSRFLRNTNTLPPVTFAVTGDWGTGKSSLMNLLYQDLIGKGFRPVWFNAWHHQKGEQLLASMFAHVRDQAIPRWLSLSGIAFRSRLMARRGHRHWVLFTLLLCLFTLAVAFFRESELQALSRIQAWLGDPDAHAADAINALFHSLSSVDIKTLAEYLVGLIALMTPLYALFQSTRGFGLDPRRLISVDPGRPAGHGGLDPGARARFAREFEDVTACLRRRMVIFIDDLDRCSKENVLEVLETVNFLATSGDCFIVIGMSTEWVETCVALGFSELAEELLAVETEDKKANGDEANDASGTDDAAAGTGNGVAHRRAFARDYLEKLINIEVPVPRLGNSSAGALLAPKAAPTAPPQPWWEQDRELFLRILAETH